MTQEVVKALSDAELDQVIVWGMEEVRARTDKRRHETIAKIKALAGEVGVNIKIEGERKRGRPKRGKDEPPEKTAR